MQQSTNKQSLRRSFLDSNNIKGWYDAYSPKEIRFPFNRVNNSKKKTLRTHRNGR